MLAAPLPANEASRLAALRTLAIRGTPADPLFADIVLLASQLCGSPIALVTLIDEDRQWFKARTGLETDAMPRDETFCAHAILTPHKIFVVEDASSDPRFHDTPLVTGATHIRFYAGASIVTAEGFALGTVCVLDTKARQLNARQASSLRTLARQVSALLDLHSKTAALRQLAAEKAELSAPPRPGRPKIRELLDLVSRGTTGEGGAATGPTLRNGAVAEGISRRRAARRMLVQGEERLTLALAGTRSSVFDWNLVTGLVHRGPGFSVMRGGDAVETVCDAAEVAAQIHTDDLPTVRNLVVASLRGQRTASEVEYRVRTLDNRWIWIRTVARVGEWSASGRVLRCTGIDEDITARKEVQFRLEESEARLKAITDNMPALIAELDTEQHFLFCNATFESWLGIAPKNLLGRTPEDLQANADHASRAVYVYRALAGERVTFEQTLSQPLHRVLQTTYVPRKDAQGTVVGLYALSIDITLQKEVQQELMQLARLDPLTGISNRRHFEELLGDAMARSRRSGETLALFYMDIDRFKSINDRHGHSVGDAVLQEYVMRVQSCIRTTDKFARLAGDEFVLLIEPISDAAQAQKVGEKILDAIREPLTLAQGFKGVITTSLGVALYAGTPGVTPAALLQRADEALYQAKSDGRDHLRFHIGPPDTLPAQ
jgi:diguanylate cyclase (GGDEF)-like protein/PAS domain S-box-containing protein